MHTADPLKQRVLASVEAVPSLTRRQGQELAGWLFALSMTIGIAVFDLIGGLGHSGSRPIAMTLRLADGWGLASAGLTWLLGRKRAGLVRSPRLLLAATTACPVLLLVWMNQFRDLYIEPPPDGDWQCFGYTLLLAAAPFASFLALKRRTEPQSPGALGAAAGAASASWAGVMVLLWCPTTSPGHALSGHVAPIALAAALGSVLGEYTLGVRRLGAGRRSAAPTSPVCPGCPRKPREAASPANSPHWPQ